MLLLAADFWKSLWYMVFPAVSVSVGGIRTGSAFCSIGGFFLQTGMEAAGECGYALALLILGLFLRKTDMGIDFAILAMSVHMTIQIFHADSKYFGPDGLYRARYAIYVTWLITPCFMAGLAFINRSGAYLSQGAFCSLPLRPFWYRLALAWIPRYLIWGFAIVTAFRVYRHVGAGFRMFVHQAGDSSGHVSQSSVNRNSHVPTNVSKSLLMTEKDDDVVKEGMTTMLYVPGDGLATQSRRPSVVRFELENGPSDDQLDSQPQSENDIKAVSPHGSDGMHEVSLNHGSGMATKGSSMRGPRVLTQDQSITQKQRAIKRQVRLLFIYPVVYGLMLVIPFINHCFGYSDYYTQHPIFVLNLLASLCWASMGLADCLCFSLREQPWRHIHGSDGTFLGSFKFWEIFDLNGGRNGLSMSTTNKGWSTQADNGGSDLGSHAERPGSKGSARKMLSQIRQKKPPPRRDLGGRSDRELQAAEDAAARLELERHERTKSTYTKGPSNPTSPIKEWFERPMSGMSHQSGESCLTKQQSKTVLPGPESGHLSTPEEEPDIEQAHIKTASS